METIMYVVVALALYGFGFMSGSIMMAKTNNEKLQDLELKAIEHYHKQKYEDKLALEEEYNGLKLAKAKPKAKRKPRAKKS